MNLRYLIICCITALAVSASATSAVRTWEEVDSRPQHATMEMMTESDDVQVSTRDGYVYVSLRRPANVKIFTILGQLIVQQQLKSGVHRFRLGSRGIYLLKAGSLTRRITI